MAIFSSFLFRHSWKKGSGKETDGDKVNSTHKSPNPTTQSAWERLMHRCPRRRSGVVERTCFFVSEDPCDRLQDRGGAVRLSAAQGLGGGTSSSQESPHPQQSPRARWDTQAACWCGLGLGPEEHADPLAGRRCPGEPQARGHRWVRGGAGLGRNHSGDMGMRGQGSSTSMT